MWLPTTPVSLPSRDPLIPSESGAIKEIAAHADPGDATMQGRETHFSQFVCYHWLCVPQTPRGEREKRAFAFLFLPRLPTPSLLALLLPGSTSSAPLSPPPHGPKTFLIISSPKYCGSVTKELTLMHVLINPQTLETRLTKILRKGWQLILRNGRRLIQEWCFW